MHSQVVILGSGPAGLTAALYAARANLSTLVIRGPQYGGLIATTNQVENYPGFAEGIGGFELYEQMELQAGRFGTQFLDAVVEQIDLSQRPFTLTTDFADTVTADALIIATGASPRKLGVPGEEELLNRGVAYCATCDGFYFQDKKVIVVGGGNSALDEGMFLTRYASELIVVHRRDQLSAEPILQERAFANPRVSFIWDTIVTEILGDEWVTGLRVKNVRTGEETILPAEGVFPYIGHLPNTNLFKGQLHLDRTGYIVTDGRTRTNIAGVFAAGDVTDPIYRQAITAAGQGSMAALEATWFLAEQEYQARKLEQAARFNKLQAREVAGSVVSLGI
jgi:thioredoxin reductase (NADPH)